MVESSTKEPIVDREGRVKALGKTTVEGQPFLSKVLQQAESGLFTPKTIFDEDDWLASVNEKGQTFVSYKNDKQINWVKPGTKNIIYVFILDETIQKTDVYLEYCKAFYEGMTVKMIKPG